MTPLPFPPRRKPSRWRRAGRVWLQLPEIARLAAVIALIVLVGLLFVGCTSLYEIRPWAGIDLKDENTRMADPRWQDAGTLWLGFKAIFN